MNDLQTNRYLALENQRLRAENAQLRKRLKESSRHAHRVKKAYEDALLLATWWQAYIIPTQDYAETHGISRRRWQNAIGLLRFAGVVKEAPSCAWLYHDLAGIDQRLQAVVRIAIAEPESYKSNLCRHANHAWEAKQAQ